MQNSSGIQAWCDLACGGLTCTARLLLLAGWPSAPTRLARTVSTGSAREGSLTPTAPGKAAVPASIICAHGTGTWYHAADASTSTRAVDGGVVGMPLLTRMLRSHTF